MPPGRIEVVSRTLISLIISYNVMLSVRIPPVTLRDYSNPCAICKSQSISRNQIRTSALHTDTELYLNKVIRTLFHVTK